MAIKTPDELAEELRTIQAVHVDDPEVVHYEMDLALLRVLVDLGYKEAATIFRAQTKWYA